MGPAAHTPLHLPPLEVASETFLLRSALPMVGAPLLLAMNSLVIGGPEPILVDTGWEPDGERWLTDLTVLVDPLAVRWIFLSHDGEGHRGNLRRALESCPNATLITSWAASERMGGIAGLHPDRVRWVSDDDGLEIGGRILWARRPPVYDSPASRVLFDPQTRVLWSSDVFATPMPVTPVDHVDELPMRMWAEGMAMLHHHAIAPWLGAVDHGSYATEVQRLRRFEPTVIVSAHAPVISGPAIEVAFEHLGLLPDVLPPPHPAALERRPFHPPAVRP